VIREVRPTFQALLLAEMTAAGVTKWVDKDTGEVHDVPGVEIKPARARTHSVTFTRASKKLPGGGRELVRAAWRGGALSEALPALAAAPGGSEAETTLRARVAELEEDSRFLAALRAHGVDNWDGYELAFEVAK
jgi:hypothetical protein